jgi:hypothetical protein
MISVFFFEKDDLVVVESEFLDYCQQWQLNEGNVVHSNGFTITNALPKKL